MVVAHSPSTSVSNPQPLPLCGPEIGTAIIDFDASGNRGPRFHATGSEEAQGYNLERTPVRQRQQGARIGDRGPTERLQVSRGTRALVLAVATGAGAGLAPLAPGTAGALVGVLLFVPFSHLGLPLYGLTLVALACLGVWVSDMAERLFARSDDGRIVVDEVVGQLLTLLPVVAMERRLGSLETEVEFGNAGDGRWWCLVVAAFVLFRLLDIWKPGPIRWVERRLAGGVGVMADDVVAGALGASLLTAGMALVAGCSGA